MTWRDPLTHSAQPAGCSPRTGRCWWSMGWSPRSSRSLPRHGNELSTAGALCPACPVPWGIRRPQPPEPSCVPRCFISTPCRRASARWRSSRSTPSTGASTDCSGEADPSPPGCSQAEPGHWTFWDPAAWPQMRALVVRTQWRCSHSSPAISSRVSATLTQGTRWRSLVSPQGTTPLGGPPPAATRSSSERFQPAP